jgi:hypothetical protein
VRVRTTAVVATAALAARAGGVGIAGVVWSALVDHDEERIFGAVEDVA